MELLAMMDRKAKENKLNRITEIHMRVGELSDLEEECMQLYFESASDGTSCEGARLFFRREPAYLRCNACGTEFPHEKSFNCPACGAPSTLIRGTGSGFSVEEIRGE